MKYLKGYFKGRYSGQHVDPLRMRSVSDLYTLNIESGGLIQNAQWIDELPSTQLQPPVVHASTVNDTDLYFDPLLYPNQRLYRETIHQCIIITPKIHSISHQANYSYGHIEGEIYAVVGTPVSNTETPIVPAVPVVEKLPVNLHASPAVSMPMSVSTDFVGRSYSWSFGNCLGILFWTALAFGILWWLLSHRGCQPLTAASHHQGQFIDSTGSVPVKKNNDTLLLHGNHITFSVYDWSVEDHDTINVYLNGQLLKQNIELNKNIYSWMQQDLNHGDNQLTIESVNNGTVGPASPTIEMNDGKNLLVFQASVYKGQPQNYHLLIR